MENLEFVKVGKVFHNDVGWWRKVLKERLRKADLRPWRYNQRVWRSPSIIISRKNAWLYLRNL
jgi:hypothetical protein